MSVSKTRSIGPYRLQDLLGRGGMGEVWLARDVRLDRSVAIKHINAEADDDPKARERFRREAWAAARIAHPAVVPIFDVVEHEAGDWIVMEYVDGPTLHRLTRDQALGLGDALRYGRQVAEGLAAAHGQGLVHRDLKSENVIIASSGHAKILDFGLAKKIEPAEGEESLTLRGQVMGTVRAMSPEQARGLDVDPRSDLFSLGVLLYEITTGVAPFSGQNTLETVSQVLTHDPPPITDHRPELPTELANLVRRLLEKSPERRPTTAMEVAAELASLETTTTPSAAFQGRAFKPSETREAIDSAATWVGETSAGDTEVGATAAPSVPSAPSALSAPDHDHDRSSRSPHPRARLSRSRILALLAVITLLTVVAIGFTAFRGAVFHGTATQGAGGGSTPDVSLEGAVTSVDARDAYSLFLAGRKKLDRFDKKGFLDEALDLFGQALAVDPKHAPSLAGLAEASWLKYEETKDVMWLDRSEDQARSAVEEDSHLAAAQLALGLALLDKGPREEAREHLETALALDPFTGRSHWALGVYSRRLGQKAETVDYFSQAVELAPDSHLFLDELGGAYFQISDFPAAEESFRQSLKVAPDGYYARRNLGAVLQMTGRSAEATFELQKALEIRPSAALYGNLGAVLFYRGLYRQAAQAFESALELGGQHYLHWANAGDAYRFIDGADSERDEAFFQAIQLAEKELATTPGDLDLESRILSYLAKMDRCTEMQGRRQDVPRKPDADAAAAFRWALAAEICGERDLAIEWTQKSLAAGYPMAAIEQEPELSSLRLSPDYQRLQFDRSGSEP